MATTGIIFDLKRYAIHDGPGIRTTVFFKGCPLNCWWCHNPESRHLGIEHRRVQDRNKIGEFKSEKIGQSVNVAEIMNAVKKDRVFYDESGGGVTFSGGEPMLQIDFLFELLKECKKINIHTVVDTSGFTTKENFEKLIGLVDLYLYDLKLTDDKLHRKYTSVPNARIFENLEYLMDTNQNIEIRIPLIPGVTDTKENIIQILEYLKKHRKINDICLLPYNMLNRDKLERFQFENKLGNIITQQHDIVDRLVEQFKSNGFNVSVGG
jgi:pyruvate formate lyase activating enzyme